MKQILWTIQHEAAYEQLCRTGVLIADNEYLLFSDQSEAYEWMADQLSKRVGNPPNGIRFPVWAWYQWEGRRSRRDLRLAGYAERGTPMVQITFEAEADSFLLSDFDLWHSVLNEQYIPANADFSQAEDDPVSPDEIRASWSRIFDADRLSSASASIQAVLWQIKTDQIVKVEHFIAK